MSTKWKRGKKGKKTPIPLVAVPKKKKSKKKPKRLRSEKRPDNLYRQLWRIVDGNVLKTFTEHPDYLSDAKRVRVVRMSLTKRIVGALHGYVGETRRRSALGSRVPADESLPKTVS